MSRHVYRPSRAILRVFAIAAVCACLTGVALAFPQESETTSEDSQAITQVSPPKPDTTSGTLDFCVRDVLTGYAFRATAQLEGPQSLTLQTDDTGCVKQDLAPGNYRVVVSAPGYKILKTHLGIGAGRTAPVTAMMESEKLPDEERPDVLDAQIVAGATLFHGYVVDGGKPLQGVKVRFVNGGVETLTDSKGHFMLSVPTPEPEYPGGMGTDTLIFEKPGYRTEMFENFGIPPEDLGPASYVLERGKGVVKHDATHKLMRKEDSGTGEEPQSVNPGGARLSRELYEWLGSSGTALPIGGWRRHRMLISAKASCADFRF